MKGFVRLMAVVVTAAVFVVACSKDKDSGAITLDSPAVLHRRAQRVGYSGFHPQNIKTLSVTSKPTGWDEPIVDLAGATISVKLLRPRTRERGWPSNRVRSAFRVTPRRDERFGDALRRCRNDVDLSAARWPTVTSSRNPRPTT